MMRSDLLDNFNASYERVMASQEFFDRFYERFLACSDEVAEKFRQTDMQLQKDILRMSLIYVVNFFVNHSAGERLEEMAASHSRDQKDIHPKFYSLWMNALVETVRECDPQFESTTELAWRVVLVPGIEYMKFHYDKTPA